MQKLVAESWECFEMSYQCDQQLYIVTFVLHVATLDTTALVTLRLYASVGSEFNYPRRSLRSFLQ